MSQKENRLRQLINRHGLIRAPGAYDALSARLIERIGFPAVYVTGSGVAASQYCLPDLGMIMLMEMAEAGRRIINAVDIPVIVDADTGYGGILNVRRTTQELINIGAAAIQLEDQQWPKKCGHFSGKELIPPNAMVQKIKAAVEARKDSGLLIVARTDAIAVEGFPAAIDRGNQYEQAGADIIFIEEPENLEQVMEIPRNFNVPVLLNMDGGKTPWVSQKDLELAGYKFVIYPGIPQLSALEASQSVLETLYQDKIKGGGMFPLWFEKFLELTGTEAALDWEKNYDL